MTVPKTRRPRQTCNIHVTTFFTLLVAAALIGLAADQLAAQATQPAAQAAPATQPAATAPSPEEALYQRIITLRPPRITRNQDREVARRQMAGWVQQALGLCKEYLAKFPQGKHLDEVQLGWLWLLAMEARVENKPLDAFYKAAEQLYAGPTSPRVKAEAGYVLMRRELIDLQKELIADKKMPEEQKRAKWDAALKKKFSAFVESHPDSPKNAELLAELIRLALQDEDFSRARSLMARRTKQFPNDPRADWLAQRIEEAAAATRPATGPVMELKIKTLDGKTIDLKDLRGKVVLLDFWATWCAPCIEALPRTKKLYETYHAKGLELIGVSLDDSVDVVRKFVKEKQIPWPQYCDAKGGAGPVEEKFQVGAVPTLILLDKTGRVAARLSGLSEPEMVALEKKINRLLKAEAAKERAAKAPAAPATRPAEN